MLRRRGLEIALVVVACLGVEIVAWLGLSAWARWTGHRYEPVGDALLSPAQRRALAALIEGDKPHVALHPRLGWTLRPNTATASTRINSIGARAAREFDAEAPAGVVRIAAFGDSFTYGYEVGNDDAWATLLGRDGLEVLNFGVPGYGLDQALLRFRQDGVAVRAHVVLIGFLSENIYRGVNVFRPFYKPWARTPLAKPRFVPRGDGLELIPNPLDSIDAYRLLLDAPGRVLPALSEHDRFYSARSRPGPLDFLRSVRVCKLLLEYQRRRLDGIVADGRYVTEGEAFVTATRTFDLFVAEVLASRSLPLIVLFPGQEDLVRYRESNTRVYDPLIDHLRARGYPYVDAMDALHATSPPPPIGSLFLEHHYSPEGNRLVAAFLRRSLEQRGLLDRAE